MEKKAAKKGFLFIFLKLRNLKFFLAVVAVIQVTQSGAPHSLGSLKRCHLDSFTPKYVTACTMVSQALLELSVASKCSLRGAQGDPPNDSVPYLDTLG